MTAPTNASREPVYFCYPNPKGFSGQKAATLLVMNGLAERGWTCRDLPQPVLDRTVGRMRATVGYGAALLAGWLPAVAMLFRRKSRLCVNLGQTRSAFVRDAVPLLLGRIGLGRSRVIISLHGSLFMHWRPDELNAWIFRFLLRQAERVTVLGERQRRHLVAMGIPEDRVAVVVNSCEFEPVSHQLLEEKVGCARPVDSVVHCLYLSSLIDTKGFPEYLEALRGLAGRPGPSIDAVLCGRLVESEFSDRFNDQVAAENWIVGLIDEINRQPRVRVRWIRGAVGAEKVALFQRADLFVLPTRYAVEAQPLVLLEAMASGCAIVTTDAGEISTILDEQSAVFLREPTAQCLAATIQLLAGDAAARAQLATAAHSRFVNSYQAERHLDEWETILATPAPLVLART